MVLAMTITILTAPLHQCIERVLPNNNLSAGISVSLLALLVLATFILPGQQLLGTLNAGIQEVQSQIANGGLQQRLESVPWLSWVGQRVDEDSLKELLGNFGTWLTTIAGSVLRETVTGTITFVLTFYLLFYFLRDRREILTQIKLLLPLDDGESNYLFGRIHETIYGVVFGILITAIIQGILGGLIFWFLELPNAVFWGLVMALLAIVPILGAFVVWIPAAIYLILMGSWTDAVLLTAFGIVVIGGIDNVLYPMLAGGRLKMHTVAAFVSIVGGIILFGASGIILGPLALTMTVAIVEIWRARMSESPA
jgi:predicted PurR-regulated permease PerM